MNGILLYASDESSDDDEDTNERCRKRKRKEEEAGGKGETDNKSARIARYDWAHKATSAANEKVRPNLQTSPAGEEGVGGGRSATKCARRSPVVTGKRSSAISNKTKGQKGGRFLMMKPPQLRRPNVVTEKEANKK